MDLDAASMAKIEEVLALMEQKRKKSILPAFLIGIGLAIVLALICFLFTGEIIITLICLIPICIWATLMWKRTQLSMIYKKEILPKLVQTLGDDVKYSPTGGVSLESFQQCGLFVTMPRDTVDVEDKLYGKIGKTDFVFSEAKYYYITYDKDRNEKRNYHFKGMAYDADFNKDFKGQTVLCKHRPSILAGWYKEAKMEDPEFNKHFRVFTTDEVEARYILSPALQERLVNLTNFIKQDSGEDKVWVSFHDSRIFILIFSTKNRFEAKIMSPLKIERVQEDFDVLRCIGGIVEDLNLNTRIWTKQ